MLSMWPRRRRASAHLSDDELLTTLFPTAERGRLVRSDGDIGTHLGTCAACATRWTELNAFLDNTAEVTESTFDATFPAGRPATQRAQILRRLEHALDRGAARILRFPKGSRPFTASWQGAHRWPTAAAAAGLLVGLILGQFLHLHPESPAARVPNVVDIGADLPAVASTEPPFPATSDEAFMDELELVLSRPQVSELSALDAITPRIRGVAVNVW